MNPLISIIIPTYGIPNYLYNAIKSVQSQSLCDWELIVVDDNNPNTDARQKTEVLMASVMDHDDRIKYIQHEHNKNGAVARNTGFAVAKGKYISLLDSDDEYMPDRLHKCFDLMEKAPDNVAGVYTGCEFRRGGKVYHVEQNVKAGNFLKETLACTFMFCTGSNIFVRKSVVDELNGFDGAFLRHQDYEFLVRVFEKYDLAAIPEVLVVKNNENFNVANLEKIIEIKQQYLDKFNSLIESLPQEKQNQIYHSQYIGIAEVAMRNKQYKAAKPFYNKAQEYGSLTRREWFRRLAFPIHNLLH